MESQPSLSDFSAPLGMSAPAGEPETLAPELVSPPDPLGQDIQLPQALIAPVGASPMAAADLTALIPEGIPGYERPQNPFEGWPFQAPEPPELLPIEVPEPLAPGQMSLEEAMAADARNRNDDRRSEDPRREQQEERTIELPRYQPGELGTLGDEFEPPPALQFAPEPDDDAPPASADLPPPAEALADFTSADDPEVLPAEYLSQVPESPVAEAPGDTLESPLDPAEPSQPPEALSPPEEALQDYNALSPLPPTEQLFPSLAAQEAPVPPGSPPQAVPGAPELSGAGGAEGAGPSLGTGDPRSLFSLEESFAAEPGSVPFIAGNLNPPFPGDASAMVLPGGLEQEALPAVDPPDTPAQEFLSLEDRFVREGFSLPDQMAAPELHPELPAPELLEAEVPPPPDGLPTAAVDLAASPPMDNGAPLSGEAENLLTAVDPETAEPTMQPPILEAAADGTASPFAGYPPEPLTEAHGSPVGEGPIPPVDFFSAPDEGSLQSSVAEPSAQVDELASIGQPGMIPQPEPLGAQPQLREPAVPAVEPQSIAQPEPPAAEPTDLPHTPQAVEPQLIAQPEPLSADTATPSERSEAEPSLPAAPAEIPFLEQTEPLYANESAPELPPGDGTSPAADAEEVFPVPPLIPQATGFPLPVEPVSLAPSELPGEVTAGEPLRATAFSEGEPQRYVLLDDAGASEFSAGAPEFSAPPAQSKSSVEAPGIDTPVEPLAEVAFLPTQDELADSEPVEFVEPLPHPEPPVQPEYEITQDQPQQPTAPFADSQSEVSGSPPTPQVESRGEWPGLPPQEQTVQVELPQSADGMGLIDQPEAGSPSPVGDEELVLPSEAMTGSALPEFGPSAFEATSLPPSEAQIFQPDLGLQSQLADGAPGGEVYGALLPESEIGEASSAISDRQAEPPADPAVPLREEPSVEPAILSSTTESISTGDLGETPEPPFVALEEQFSQEGLPEPVLLAAAEPFVPVDTPVPSSSDGELQAAIGDEQLPAAAFYEAAGSAPQPEAQPLQTDMPTRLESSGEPVPPEGFAAQGDPSMLESLEPELSASLENPTPIGSDAVAVPQLSLREQPAAEPDPAVPLELPLDDETPAEQVAQAQTWLEELSGGTPPLSPLQPVELSEQSEPLLPFETQAPGEAPEGIFSLETETVDSAGGSDGPVASLEAVESSGEPEPVPVLEAEASELSEQPDTLLSPVTTEPTDEPPSAGPPASPMGIPGDEPEIFAPPPAQTAAEAPEATVLSALQTPPAAEAWSGQPEAMLPLEGQDPQATEFLEPAGEPVFTSLEAQFTREQPPGTEPVVGPTAPTPQRLAQPQALGETTAEVAEWFAPPEAIETPTKAPESLDQPEAFAEASAKVPDLPSQPQAIGEGGVSDELDPLTDRPPDLLGRLQPLSEQALPQQSGALLLERPEPLGQSADEPESILPTEALGGPDPLAVAEPLGELELLSQPEPLGEAQPMAPQESLAETELATPLVPLSETASPDDAVSFAQLQTPGEFQSSEAPLQATDSPIEPAADELEPEYEVSALEEQFAQEQGQPISTISADGTAAVQEAPDSEVGFTSGLPGEILTSTEETVAPSEASAAAGLETQPVAVPTPELATPVLDVSEGEFFSEPPFQVEQAELLPQPEPLPQSTPEASPTQASISLEEPFVGEELPGPQPQVVPDAASAVTPAELFDPIEDETELAVQPEMLPAAEPFVPEAMPDASSSPELPAVSTAQAMPGGAAEAIRPKPPVTLEEASAAIEQLGAAVPGEGLETPEPTFAALEDQFSQEGGFESGVFTAEPPLASDDPSSNAELPLEALQSELPAEFPVQLLEAEAQELPLSDLSAFTELEERFAPEPTAELAAVAPKLAAAAEPTSDDEIVVEAVVPPQPLEIPGEEPEAGLPLQPAELSGEPESLPLPASGLSPSEVQTVTALPQELLPQPELPTLAAIEPDLTPVDEVRAIEPDLPPLSEREIRPGRSEDRSTPNLTTLEALPVDGEAADDQPESPLGVARDLSVLRSLSEAALPLEADGIVPAAAAFALPDEPGETTGIDPTRAAIDDTQEIPDADGVFDPALRTDEPAPEDGSVAAEGPLGVAQDLTVLRPLAGDGFSPTVAQDLGVLGLLGVAAGVFAAAGSEAIDPVEYGPLLYALAEQDPLDEAGGALEALLTPLDATVPEPFPPQLAADWPATSDRPLGMDVQPLGVPEVPALGLEAGVPLMSVADLQDFDADLLEADLEAPTLPTASERTLGQGPLLFAAQLLADQQPEEDAEAEPEVPPDHVALQSDFAQQEPDGFSGAGKDEMEVEPLVLQEYLLQLEARKNAEEEEEEEEDDGGSELPTVAGEAAALSGAAFAPLLFAGSGALTDALGRVDHQIPDNWSDIEELLTVSAAEIGLGTTLPADTGSSSSTGGGGGGGAAQEAASTYSGYMGDSIEQVLLSGQLPAHVPHPPPTEAAAAAAQGNLEEAEEADVENADLEMLAQEIYGLLRQRLEVERERSGHHYLGRMPW
ncbi:MAG: hypothetical protein KME03_12225 [Aphanocapsa lilacina HA4352-LM1]|jgi:hypothetical protein|nr:hypothetical protein [Aphanocapsa lilacina HA4352-LM1]